MSAAVTGRFLLRIQDTDLWMIRHAAKLALREERVRKWLASLFMEIQTQQRAKSVNIFRWNVNNALHCCIKKIYLLYPGYCWQSRLNASPLSRVDHQGLLWPRARWPWVEAAVWPRVQQPQPRHLPREEQPGLRGHQPDLRHELAFLPDPGP